MYEKNNVPWGKWNAGTPRDPKDVEEYYRVFRKAVRIAKDKMFPVTYNSILARQAARPDLQRRDMPALIEAAQNKLSYAELGGASYSAAELFGASARLLLDDTLGSVPVRHVGGPRRVPVSIGRSVIFSAQDIRGAAWEAADAFYIPEGVRVGAHIIGPAEFLCAAGQVLAGESDILIEPRNQVPEGSVGKLDKFKFAGWMYPRNFTGDKVLEQLKLLLWTYHPE